MSAVLKMMFQYWYTDDFVKTKVVKFIGSLIYNVLTLSVLPSILDSYFRLTDSW